MGADYSIPLGAALSPPEEDDWDNPYRYGSINADEKARNEPVRKGLMIRGFARFHLERPFPHDFLNHSATGFGGHAFLKNKIHTFSIRPRWVFRSPLFRRTHPIEMTFLFRRPETSAQRLTASAGTSPRISNGRGGSSIV